MAYSYKGSISFGLVYIPITLHSSVKEGTIAFNLLDRRTMSRVVYKKTCVDCENREVKQEDIVKGFQYEDGKYVVFEEEDFEKLKTPKDRNITIEKFVDLESIDPIYFDKPYYVNPIGGEKAYALLLNALELTGKAGIAKTVLGAHETLIAIRVKDGKMLLNTLFFQDEIQKNPAKDLNETVSAPELHIAKAIIDQMSGTFEPEQYSDEYRKRLQKAIEAKISGKKLPAPKKTEPSKAIDLMEALQLTLKLTARKPKPRTNGVNSLRTSPRKKTKRA